MRVHRRNMDTLHAEIIDSIQDGSIICSDGWAAYRGLLDLDVNGQQRYRDHLVVIHDRNFLDPPRSEDPYFRHDINFECRDKQFSGPLPQQYANHNPEYLPFRCHTQHVERSWIELKRKVRSNTDFDEVDRYIGSYL